MLPTFDISATTRFTLAEDPGPKKTVFVLGMLDAKTDGYLNSCFSTVEYRHIGKDDDGKPKVEPVASFDRDGKDIETVMLGLKGVENFGTATLSFIEKVYPFGKRQVLTEASINLLKPYIAEIAAEIRRINTFDTEAKKN